MLTQDQINDFHRDGFLIMRGLIKGRELELLQEAAERVKKEGVSGEGAHHLFHQNEDGSRVYWRSEHMWQRGTIFQAVTVNPDILENVGQCLGQPFFPWNDSLVVKLAGEGAPVPWHQDPPYGTPYGDFRDETFPVPNFTTDIYLDYSGPDNGGVWAIHGHHLVGAVDLKGKSQEELEAYGAKPLILCPGDVMFHCLSTPHGSRPNLSDMQRRIFYIAYLSQESYDGCYGNADWAKSRPGWTPARQSLVHDMLAARRQFGWSTPCERETLNLSENGWEFTASPATPNHHWATLNAAIVPEKRAAMKQLQTV